MFQLVIKLLNSLHYNEGLQSVVQLLSAPQIPELYDDPAVVDQPPALRHEARGSRHCPSCGQEIVNYQYSISLHHTASLLVKRVKESVIN